MVWVLPVLCVSLPKLVYEVEMHEMQMHSNPEQEESHPDEDRRQEDGVYGTRDAVEIVGESGDDCEQKGSDDDPQACLHEPGVSSDLLDTVLDLGGTDRSLCIWHGKSPKVYWLR